MPIQSREFARVTDAPSVGVAFDKVRWVAIQRAKIIRLWIVFTRRKPAFSIPRTDAILSGAQVMMALEKPWAAKCCKLARNTRGYSPCPRYAGNVRQLLMIGVALDSPSIFL